VTDRRLTLTASQRPATLDARRGVVRLHPEVLAALGVQAGEPVLLAAGRTTAGIAALADEASSRGLLLADDVTLGNLRVRSGAQGGAHPAWIKFPIWGI
jgi:transitional endoplasmic reticulum ATPase